jgi:hypothetical protein
MTSQELVTKLQIEGSYQAKAILALSQKKIDQLLGLFDPDSDGLIHVCDEYFSINHGNVGSRGINYQFHA